MPSNGLGSFILEHREALGMTQVELMDGLAANGWHKYGETTVSGWENGYRNPPVGRPKFVTALAKTLNVSETEIYDAAGFNLNKGPETWLAKLNPENRKTADKLLKALYEQQKKEEEGED